LKVLNCFLLGLLCLCLQAGKLPAGRHQQGVVRLNHQLKKQKQPGSSYRFVVAGDNRDGNRILAQILQQAAKEHPDFMLHSGDFVALGQKQEYLNLLKLLDRAPFPIFAAMGNHEIYQGGEKWYRSYFGNPDFYFDVGPDRFVILNNANAALKPEQIQWLDQVLQRPRRYKFLLMHYPPQNLIWFYAFSEGANRLREVVTRHHVNYVFMGHIHIYDQLIQDGVHWLISGGAGAPLYRMPLYYSPQGGAYSHYVVMDISPEGIRETLRPLN